METQTIDAALYHRMIVAGTANLRRHAARINDLNVFPIPDGDTGDNMLLTMRGGAGTEEIPGESLGQAAARVGDGMLLSARGNSGVILSQFFDGVAAGLSGTETADAATLGEAFRSGVRHAYSAVMTPTEGTILTVAREATDYACGRGASDATVFLSDFLYEANRSLLHTPELLPVLRQAGVVDSGGAGLIRVVEGMLHALTGEELPGEEEGASGNDARHLDLNRFTADSVLEFGYCTELLLRLQNAKVDVENFDIAVITDELNRLGDSVVAVKNGSIVKIHVHTKIPDRVLALGQRFGEFLTVKIENMTLQHNQSTETPPPEPSAEHKAYGLVAVACGEGIRRMFRELGADAVVDGGQSMNPSAKDFLEAFDRVGADTIFVLPNNGNIILTARQAAKLYTGAEVRVIETHNIGEGHAALTMFDTTSDDADTIETLLRQATEGVITAAVSTCSRDTDSDALHLWRGEYIGFVGDHILSADRDRVDTACRLLDELDFADREICIMICGKDADATETEAIRAHLAAARPGCEIYPVDGGQDIYHYIFIIE